MNWASLGCLSGASQEALSKLDRVAHTLHYQAGAVIFSEGLPCAGFHVVLEGMVRIFRISPEGRIHTLSLLHPLATFNEIAAVDGQSNPTSAVAVTACQVVRVSHEQFWDVLASERSLLQSYMATLARVNREYIERLEDMTFRTIPSRLAKLFLYETSYIGGIPGAPSNLTQEEMASILGTSREVVGRALRALFNAGLLRKKGRQVFIVDRAALERLAETNEMPFKAR
jgi:CRP/FNR family transcriptional regulator